MAVIGSLFWHFNALTLLQGEEKDGAYVSIRQHTSAYVRHLNALLFKVKKRTEQCASNFFSLGRKSQSTLKYFVLEKQVLFVLVKHEKFETVRQYIAVKARPHLAGVTAGLTSFTGSVRMPATCFTLTLPVRTFN